MFDRAGEVANGQWGMSKQLGSSTPIFFRLLVREVLVDATGAMRAPSFRFTLRSGSCIVDGEAVACGEDGKSDFELALRLNCLPSTPTRCLQKRADL
jgi:hypothetical protein